MSRFVSAETDLVSLGAEDFAEVKRRMNYGDTRKLATMFSGPTPMAEYLAGVLEVNVVALRGPGFGCTLAHDHGDAGQTCDAIAIARAVLDRLDPDDAEVIIAAIGERNQSVRRAQTGERPLATTSAGSS